jgi:preprotein translocase subunit SecA
MIKKVVESIFGSRHDREVKKLQPVLAAIREEEARLADLDEAALRGQTEKFRGILAERTGALRDEVDRLRVAKHGCTDPVEREGLEDALHKAEAAWHEAIAATLDDLLPEAFATVREACRRLGNPTPWNMVPYDVQLIGAIAMHRGRIAEMATGEGKTLVAVLPLYLNALPGRGAHLITVNNYLARRDSQWMGHVFSYLGLSVRCLDDTAPSSPERREAYNADIT